MASKTPPPASAAPSPTPPASPPASPWWTPESRAAADLAQKALAPPRPHSAPPIPNAKQLAPAAQPQGAAAPAKTRLRVFVKPAAPAGYKSVQLRYTWGGIPYQGVLNNVPDSLSDQEATLIYLETCKRAHLQEPTIYKPGQAIRLTYQSDSIQAQSGSNAPLTFKDPEISAAIKNPSRIKPEWFTPDELSEIRRPSPADDRPKTSSSPVSHKIRFTNPGTLCWLCSTLYAIATSDTKRRYLLKGGVLDPNDLFRVALQQYETVLRGEGSGSIDLTALANEITQQLGQQVGRHQDAHEGLLNLLKRIQRHDQDSPFAAALSSTMQYEDGERSDPKKSGGPHVPLIAPGDGGGATWQTQIHDFFREPLPESKPSKYGKPQELQNRMSRAPQTMIVEINRFHLENGRFNDVRLQASPRIGIERQFLGGQGSQHCHYQLESFIHYDGLGDAGHYVTYVREGDGRWTLFDGAGEPRTISEEAALAAASTNAYLLFFDREEERPAHHRAADAAARVLPAGRKPPPAAAPARQARQQQPPAAPAAAHHAQLPQNPEIVLDQIPLYSDASIHFQLKDPVEFVRFLKREWYPALLKNRWPWHYSTLVVNLETFLRNQNLADYGIQDTMIQGKQYSRDAIIQAVAHEVVHQILHTAAAPADL